MKIGDNVRIVNTPYWAKELQPGQTGTIAQIQGSNSMFYVKLDSGYNDNGTVTKGWCFLERELEVIEKAVGRISCLD